MRGVPMAIDLKDQLTKALTAFNNAQQKKSYDDLSNYLAERLTVHRVDDLTPVQGRKSDVLTIFSDNSDGCQNCPVFDFEPATMTVSTINPNVVSVKGKYYDKQTDYPDKKLILIICSYHFTGGLIDRALPVHLPQS
jgi:hypothetical protein